MNTGRKIAVLRKQRNMKQDELAELAGYTSRAMISRIEHGLVDLPQSKIVIFADIFGVSPVSLISDEPYEVESFDEGVFWAKVEKSADMRDMIHKFMELNDEQKKTVRQMIDVLTSSNVK